MGEHRHTNRLVHETSPYLQQHAHNPVDWYPWGEAALAKAKGEDKPILLSIGYSACHWCHVMERESFEDEAIAAIMNEHFVNIKVDREERPDLDQIYQNVVQMLGGHGGWPLTMFLTPEGKPFYGGTYFPPTDRHGIPSFPRVLRAVAQAYNEKSEAIADTIRQVLGGLEQISRLAEAEGALDSALLDAAARGLARSMDPVHGGFGSQPKFPNTMNLAFLLRRYKATGDQTWLKPVALTLRRMAEGGIYDQLGGGFHRYSVDNRWLVPHFEKMLYDNALLLRITLEAYQATGEPLFRRVAEEIVGYARREMFQPEGGFYSTQDADSEGEEGKFFVWTKAEVLEILGPEAGDIFCRAYDVSEAGNFEHGRNILHAHAAPEQLALRYGRQKEEIETILAEARAKLFAVREKRVKPFRDEKVLTSWNGLMIGACAEAARVLGDRSALEIVQRSIEFILTRLHEDGRLLAVYKDGHSKLTAYLDDYAFLVWALLDTFEATFDRRHLDRALALHEVMMGQFWDPVGGGFYFTGRDHEVLINRPKSAYDHSIPSGSSVAVHNLLRLHHLTGEHRHREQAEKVFRLFRDAMEQNPFGFGNLLCALDFYVETPKEIVIVGPRESPETAALLDAVNRSFVPNRVLFLVDGADGGLLKLPPMAEGKGQVGGKATAYVCHRMTCSAPVTTAAALAELLTAR